MLNQPTERVKDITTYHACDADQIHRISNVREATALLIQAIEDNCPPCADRSAAIRLARETLMTANAAIALKGMC